MAIAKDAAVKIRELVRGALDKGGRGAQKDFALRVGVRPQTVTKWLSGENEIPQWRWLEVERALELAPLDLARAAGLALDIPEEELVERWAQLYPPPSNQLVQHLEAVNRAMEEGRPVPRRFGEQDDAARIDALEERLEAVEGHVRRLEALVGEAVAALEAGG